MHEATEKEVMLDKLIGMQDVEASKPLPAMDTDLIAECSECILDLTEETPPSANTLEQWKQKLLLRLFGQKTLRYRKGMLRKLLIAAIIILLIVALSVATMPLGTNDTSLLERWNLSLLLQGSGSQKKFDDYLSLFYNGEVKEYKSIRQFVRKTGLDVLVPTVMPDGCKVQQVNVCYVYHEEYFLISFVTNNPEHVGFSICLNKTGTFASWEETEKIGNYDCAFASAPGWYQCNFNDNGNSYSITAESREDLILILTNLKGSLQR